MSGKAWVLPQSTDARERVPVPLQPQQRIEASELGLHHQIALGVCLQVRVELAQGDVEALVLERVLATLIEA